MPLAACSRLGAHEIQGLLGAGGMGEVIHVVLNWHEELKPLVPVQ